LIVAEAATDIIDLASQCIHIGRDGVFLSGVGVEVAVGAAMGAEWNMEIQAVHGIVLP
jgi:hypothetical protein